MTQLSNKEIIEGLKKIRGDLQPQEDYLLSAAISALEKLEKENENTDKEMLKIYPPLSRRDYVSDERPTFLKPEEGKITKDNWEANYPVPNEWPKLEKIELIDMNGYKYETVEYSHAEKINEMAELLNTLIEKMK